MSFEYQQTVVGKEGISAKIVADSISKSGKRITTFELEYPRWILAELNTHRQFSRNSMSSRAIPVNKQIQQIIENPAMPVFWGKNQSGMVAKESWEEEINFYSNTEWWKLAALSATRFAQNYSDAGYHKQIVNRLLEPFQRMKTVLTATEFDNFFKLRLAPDAQPEIQELARCMKEAMDLNKPEFLKEGEWHTPYVEHFRGSDGDAELIYIVDNIGVSLEDAKSISTSCCAQVSYREIDSSYDKAMSVYVKLGLNTDHAHLSPTEHQATPIPEKMWTVYGCDRLYWVDGITHVDKDCNLWSGNLNSWIQHRQLIEVK